MGTCVFLTTPWRCGPWWEPETTSSHRSSQMCLLQCRQARPSEFLDSEDTGFISSPSSCYERSPWQTLLVALLFPLHSLGPDISWVTPVCWHPGSAVPIWRIWEPGKRESMHLSSTSDVCFVFLVWGMEPHARQVLYHWVTAPTLCFLFFLMVLQFLSHTTGPFCSYFSNRVSHLWADLRP
jgi:hypothetical protein